jgi:NhaP-type Na+/H+ or K+/H+ antiporter
MSHGLEPVIATTIAALVLSTVVVSIVIHGVSVTPLMRVYERRKPRRRAKA